MGNTLGAIVFLAAGTYLGWTVLRGRAQGFLSAVSSPQGMAAGGGGGGAGAPPSTSEPHGGPLAGAGFNLGADTLGAPAPNIFGNAFGENGTLYGPNNEGPYGPFSPNYASPQFTTPAPQLAPSQGVFGSPQPWFPAFP